MATDNIKKIIIPKNDLPPISAEDNTYYVRFRIVEGLRYSPWSVVNAVSGIIAPVIDPLTKVSIAINAVSSSIKTVTAVWSPPAEYDIDTVYVYVKWTDHLQPAIGEWQYVAKVSSTTYATVVPATVTLTDGTIITPTRVEVAVQVPTYPKIISTKARLFTSAITVL